MIVLKDTVRFKRLTPEIIALLPIIIAVWSKNAVETVPVITSANDSTHGKNSYHYSDYAIDLRSKNLSNEQKLAILADLKQSLSGRNYDVLLESLGTDNEHFHIEFNARNKQ